MQTLLSYQKFTEQTNKGFVKVPTLQAKKTWRNLLIDYRYLHAIGVTITKNNRVCVFNTLAKLKTAQSDLINAIDNDESTEVKDELKTIILNLQKLLSELSSIKDADKEDESEAGTPFVHTLIYFDKKIVNEGENIYITKGGKRFRVKDKTAENNHLAMLEKFKITSSLRVDEAVTVTKTVKETKEPKEKAVKVPKTKTVKVKKDKPIDPNAEAKKAEKREALQIGREYNSTDKFTERVFEKKRLF